MAYTHYYLHLNRYTLTYKEYYEVHVESYMRNKDIHSIYLPFTYEEKEVRALYI